MTPMARDDQGAGGRGEDRPRPVLADHHHVKRKRIPPLMRHPMTEVSWHRDMLPDFLWIALMLGRRSDWRAVRSALDVLDRFVPEGERCADGRLSTFALVPEERRESARLALRTEASHALPEVLGHALGPYPECPALWLYEDWLESREPDADAGLALLRSLVGDNREKSSEQATHLRMAALSRNLEHGIVQNPSIIEMGARYPDGMIASELSGFRSQIRASWMSFAGVEDYKFPPNEWPAEFWRRSRELTPCRFTLPEEEMEMEEERSEEEFEDGPLDAEPLMQLSEMRAVLKACDTLGEQLRATQLRAFTDPDTDEPNAVLLGLASRLYRLLYVFIERPTAWAPDTSPLYLRPLVDTRILIAWLITRDEPELFAAYREHGLGRLKLLREHIKNDLGEDLDEDAREFLDFLDARVNLERDEWFQPVNLGSFSGVDTRKMAIESGLKREYDLHYAPLSSENHGEWPAVREDDTLICEEVMHGNHRIGAFRPPQRITSAAPVFLALEHGRAGICQVFDHYGTDIRAAFEPGQNALEKAAYSGEDEDSSRGS